MQIRRTGAADLPLLYDIFSEAIGELYRRHAFEPPAPPYEVFAAQQRHLLEHDRELSAVAEEDGEPVAFAAAWARADSWFLASLFVRPRAQARGIGRALLDAVWGAEFAHRRTITDAIQPVSNALYADRGLIPATPILSFGGRPQTEATAVRVATAAWDANAVRRIDEAAYGFDRAPDHALWGARARRTLWSDDRGPVAYSYVFPGGLVGPVAATSPSAGGAGVAAELARADGEVRVRVPGSAAEVVGEVVAAGLRLAPAPGLLLLNRNTRPPTALAIGSYTLF